MKALGYEDPILLRTPSKILFASAKDNKYDLKGFLFTLAVAKSTAPKDELEAMQLTQMAAIHAAMMKATGQLARAESVIHQEAATRAVNQLARTYTAQMEAVKRYRSGGRLGVAVQNVSVSDGGQAIVTQGSPASAKEVANAIPALTDARQRPMEIISKPQRDLVSTPQKAEPASPSSVRKRRPERLLESNMTKELTGRASTAESKDRSNGPKVWSSV